jgi:adenine deaminase
MSSTTHAGTIVDIINRKMFPGTIILEEGKIKSITHDPHPKTSHYILPGFIDAHIHIESSMLIPSEFARIATIHGTVATVSDPHEIGNVLGIEGVRYMIQNGNQVPFHFYFGVPSCVPATTFESSGATISSKEVETLFREDNLKYLSEMMNFPGVLSKDAEVMEKIRIAKSLNKPVDGHAPGLKGEVAENYIKAGISTDHECYTLEEALDKLKYGMHIIIREGSAAKNYEELSSLIKTHPDKVMFCSDDKHPHELVEGHINELVKKSIVEKGYDLMDVLRIATLNPILHYNLEVGLLQLHDSADFIIIDNLHDFNVIETYIKGILVAKNGEPLIPRLKATAPNHLSTSLKKIEDFSIQAKEEKIRVILVEEGQLITQSTVVKAKIEEGHYQSDVDNDILKLTVVNRYGEAKPAIGFVKNFGLKRGALASCIAHDSHNIIAVGCSDEAICRAVNLLIKHKGGIAVVDDENEHILALPVAGIMSNEEGFYVAKKYAEMDAFAKGLGSHLEAPFMTLSFMALLVIPELKLSDKGLFDGNKFEFTSLAVSPH